MLMGMDNKGSCVSVKKSDLMDALTKNMAAHRNLFLKAQEGFRVEVIKHLDEMLKDARAGKSISLVVDLPTPIDQTKDYARVIRMLEMCTQDVVIVSEQEFNQYVMDDWSWSHNVGTTNSSYAHGR